MSGRVTISGFVGESRVVSGHMHKYSVRDGQAADFLVGLKGGISYQVVYLPAAYHAQHPNYFHTKIATVKQQTKHQDRLLVVTLTESSPQETAAISQLQGLCLTADVNLMVCFEVDEVRQLIDDISRL